MFLLGPSCSEGMVLQRGRAVLWGWAEPGSEHRFEVDGSRAEARAEADGRWTAVWTGLAPGGPYRLTRNGGVLFEQVWIGDVWLCSGQSNMERSLEACAPWPSDAQEYRGDPGLRQLCLPNQFDYRAPARDIPGARWIGADTEEVVRFSAAAFHFGRELRARTGVPQGLVLAAVGGSTAQAWLSSPALEAFPDCRDEALRFATKGWLDGIRQQEEERRRQWYGTLESLDPQDPARAGSGPWTDAVMPRLAPEAGFEDRRGSLWLRRQIDLETGGDGAGRLNLGTLVDSDEVWVNRRRVGSTAYQYPSRRYPVPAGTLRAGSNEILIRLTAPRGGIGATPGKLWKLDCAAGSIDLSGLWQWRSGAVMPELPADVFLPLISLGLFNGLLAPLAPLAFRAVLWYQGESNLEGGPDYEALMKTLLADWRRLFGRPDLPFVLVQLPLFGPEAGYSDDGWARVRDIQRRLAALPGTALAIGLDAGEWNDIHPAPKHLIGLRLALAARKLVLGEPLETWTGPLYDSHEVTEGRVLVRFTQTGDGLTTRGPLRAFFLAGADGVFHQAEAQVEKNSVAVWSPRVPFPVEVRYAWASNPAGATLVNSLGLPASPFRIGSFP